VTVTAPISHNTAETQFVEAAGIEFAYRRFGVPADTPLLMSQHFRGNLDNGDPARVGVVTPSRCVCVISMNGAALLMVQADRAKRVCRLNADQRFAGGSRRLGRRTCPGSHQPTRMST
jgi:hypothetical protein